MDSKYIYIVIAALAVVFIILLIVMLNVFVFSVRKMEKKFNEFNVKYTYLHDLLTSQDKQYIERVDIISRTNLLFTEVYKKYLDIYKNLKANYDEPLGKVANELKISVDQKDKKGFKAIYQHNISILDEYENELKKLDDDLVLVIKPEEDCRQSALLLKDKFRNIRIKYKEHEEELSDLAPVFEKLFSNIEKKFDDFEECLKVAQFDEAKEFLAPLTKVLNEIEIVLEKMPSYLEEINHVVPTMLGETTSKYNELKNQELPLKHLDIDSKIQVIKNNLIEIRDGFQKLKTHKVDEKIAFMKSLLEDINSKMEAEVAAKDSYNTKYAKVLKDYEDLSRAIINLNNRIPHYGKYYVLTDSFNKKLVVINDKFDTLTKAKRRFDYYIHGFQNTYYTDLLNKAIDLENGVNELKTSYDEFKAILDSFKIDADAGFKTNNDTYLKTKKCELMLRNLNNDIVLNNFKEEFQTIYALMDEIYRIVKTIPIDIDALNSKVAELKEASTQTFAKAENLNNFKALATTNLLFINREQFKFSDIHNHVLQAENLYFNGDYEASYNLTEETLKNLKDKEKVNK